MDFPDRAQLERLSESLWDKMPVGRAAVMVGAGFSMNSDPIPGNRRRFPSWAGLAEAMARRLGSNEGGGSGKFPKSFLRLASEYEAAFGRNDLNHLIVSEIPDLEYAPSDLHRRLLELPWTDVFTTNYDTLLERTPVQKRAYHVVTKPTDLSRDRGPRIVKLHGSLPSQAPFIVTEDDFRTYPAKFAPFVNTVRQSLLENSFLLLGFSGEDPNFLNWAGWVRDQIGDEHCPLYLCGVLSLDTGQKSLLESQGIRLIDLSPVVANIESPSLTHRVALEWFLEELHAAEPMSTEVWPEISPVPHAGRKSSLPPPLPPLSHFPDEPEIELPLDEDFWKSTLVRWRAEREAYPGWLVAPGFIRQKLWEKTANRIELLFSTTESWPIAEKLLIAREVDWRITTALGFYTLPWLKAIETIIEESMALFESDADWAIPHLTNFDIDASSARAMIFDLVISCARDARESFDFGKWKSWIEFLENPLLLNERRQAEVDFEKALCLLWQGKRVSARHLLNRYASCRSPGEQLKKASLFLELDDLAKATDNAERALSEIREGLRLQGDNIELLSLEGWALLLINNIPTSQNPKEKKPQRDEFRRRWRELRTHLCDPWPIKEELEEQLNRETPSERSGIRYSHAFHPFRLTKTQTWIADTITQFLPAFSYVRLFEMAGIPMRTSHYRLADQALYSAIHWTNSTVPGWTPALMIRRGSHKAFRDEDFLSRHTVALLPEDQVSSIYGSSMETFREIVEGNHSASTMSSGDGDSLTVCVEILSRLAFRLADAQLSESFEKCTDLRQLPGLSSHLTLHDVCDPWFERLIFCAPDSLLRDWLVKILKMPPFDPSGESEVPESYRWIDPIRHYDLNRTTEIGLSRNSTELSYGVSRTLQMAKMETGELRDRLVARLIRLHIWGLLSKDENQELGNLIWKKGAVVTNLPRCSGFTLNSFFRFPCPDLRQARLSMKRAMLEEMPTKMVEAATDENMAETAQHLGRWFSKVQELTHITDSKRSKLPKVVTWNQSEWRRFLRMTLIWWEKFSATYRRMKKGNVIPQAQFFHRNHLVEHVEPFRSFLKRVVISRLGIASEEEISAVKQLVREAEELFPPDLSVRVALIPELSRSEASRLTSEIEIALDADDSDVVKDALKAVDEWRFRRRFTKGYPKVPRILIQHVVEGVAHNPGRPPLMAFDILSSEVNREDGLLTTSDISLLARAVKSWEQATRVIPRPSKSSFELAQQLDIRAKVASLTVALISRANQRDGKILHRVKESLNSDVLPEVRRALERRQ
ncbi:MAG: SIR2 family protein [Akkermansiaceae bacterium]|nr:SIR2 family protein [Akkermansiaceae bacterium]